MPPPGRRVEWKADRATKGEVIQEGPEVSEVRWDDGPVRFVPNYDLSTQGEEVDMTGKPIEDLSGPELAARYNELAPAK